MNNKKDIIILYSIGCPRCLELKKLMKLANIDGYTEISDAQLILQEGFTDVPGLSVNGKKMESEEAFEWCKSLINH